MESGVTPVLILIAIHICTGNRATDNECIENCISKSMKGPREPYYGSYPTRYKLSRIGQMNILTKLANQDNTT